MMEKMLEQALKHKGEFNEITLYPHSSNDIEKLLKCNKCGEQFILILRTARQGDMKVVPVWIILEESGNRFLKENMKVCYRERYICTFGGNNLKPGVENAISHYDDYALEEMENRRCVMNNCDGVLEDFIPNGPDDESDKNSTSTATSEK